MGSGGRYQVEWVPVDSLAPKQFGNPNRMSPLERARLVKSVESEGIVPPLLVRLETGEVIDGEHRWEIARELGWAEVPVVRASMTDAQARIIARRRIMARGSEVPELVADLMKELAELGALEEAQDSLLLSDEEIRKLDAELDVDVLDPDADTLEFDDPPIDPIDDEGDDAPPPAPPPGTREPRARTAADLDRVHETMGTTLAPRAYRVNVIFVGDEADLIQKVLGRAPAAVILEMARYWAKNNMEEALLDTEEEERVARGG